MGAQGHLLKLVDLALCNPEVGAVNFNHLKTLLLAIINGSFQEKSDSNENEANQQEDNLQNQVAGGDSGINLNQINDQNKDLSEKLQKVFWSQEKLEERINSLDEDLNSYAKFASNGQILRNSSIDEGNAGSRSDSAGGKRVSSTDILAPTWQNMKTTKRLESVEEAIDKLFSLLNELLEKQPKNKGDEEDKLNELRKDITELATSSDTRFKSLHEQQQNLDKKYGELSQDLKRLEEEINKMKSNINQNQNDVSANKSGIDKNLKLIDTNHKAIEVNSKAIEDLRKTSSSLKKQLNDSKADISNTAEKGETQGNYSREESNQMVHEELNDINKRIDELTGELNNKSDNSTVKALSDDLSSLDKKVEESLKDVQDEVNKLKESISNLDNAELKSVLSSMDDLKKMADQIEDLRKLNDLKDLADNVDSLKDLKSEMDRLNEALEMTEEKERDSSKMLEEFLRKQKEMEGSLNEVRNDVANEKIIENGKNSLPNDALENKVVGLNEELNKFKDMYDELSKMFSDLQKSSSDANNTDHSTLTGLDPSMVAAIQHLAQQNRQQIAALQADLNILKKLQLQTPPSPQNNNNNNNTTNNNNSTVSDSLHNHLGTLQEEQVKMAGQFANLLDDTKGEFLRKQQHIDALYDYIDKLQNNKADKGDITSSMDVKADKQALDSKVNMSTFDERYQMLEQALQDALTRLDQFVEKENSLTNALNKLHSDLDSKMDSDAEKNLKKFMDDRLKEIQKSRNNLQADEHDHSVLLEMRNAAGLRRPMPLSYHCISCDRPVDITLRGVMGSIPQNFPAKKSMGPYTSFELDQLRNNMKKVQHPSIERMNGGRQCGGHHTTVNSTMYRTQKNHQFSNDFTDAFEKNLEQEDLSVIDCVMGKDGQIYRGRFKPNQYVHPIPKRVAPPNPRTKHHIHKHRYTHSATMPANKDADSLLLKEEGRASSANIPVKDDNTVSDQPALSNVKNGSPVAQTANRDRHRGSRNNSPSSRDKQRATNTSPVSLPPISRDCSLVGDELVNGSA